jgi:hypothetical protein
VWIFFSIIYSKLKYKRVTSDHVGRNERYQKGGIGIFEPFSLREWFPLL